MEKGLYIWMDGSLVDWDKAQVHVLTHSLHYGVAVFEGIRCYSRKDGGAVFRLSDHIQRLFESAHIAVLKIPFTKEELIKGVVDTLKANNLSEAYIRPLVYLGAGTMGIMPKDNPVRVMIAAWKWGAYLGEEGIKNGIRVKISSFARHFVNSSMTKAKITGNYANSLFAKREAVSEGFDEAVLLDTEGYVSEGSGENIFIVKKGIIKTTPLTSILGGITRDSIIELAREKGIEVREERFTRDELYTADEAFLTGTAAELTPIREVDMRSIGTGSPGPITKDLQATFFGILKGTAKVHEQWCHSYKLQAAR